MDEDSESHISEIAVAPFRAGGKGQRNALDDSEFVGFGVVLAEVELLGIVAKSRSMTKQFAYRDLFPGRRRIRQVMGDRIIEFDFPVFHKHHHRRRGELFAH